MESVKRHETGWLQHGLLVIVALVTVIMLGTAAGLLARHFTGSGSSSAAPTTHSSAPVRGLNGDAQSGYAGSSGPARPLNSDSQSGYAGRIAPSGARAIHTQ